MKSHEEMKKYKREWARNNRLNNLGEIRARKRAYYALNKERLREYKNTYRDANREHENERERLRRQANPEQSRAASRRWAEANPERKKATWTRWYSENIEREQERSRRYYHDNLDSIRARFLVSYYGNPEKYRKRSLQWGKLNPEKRREWIRRWYSRNPEKPRLYSAKRRMNGGTASPDIVKTLWNRQNGLCAYASWCQGDLFETGFHLDHILPFALGGRHEDVNLQLLCPSCNLSKGAKHPEEFGRVLRERLRERAKDVFRRREGTGGRGQSLQIP